MKSLLYAFVFLSGFANSICSGSSHRPTTCSFDTHIGQEHPVFIDNAFVADFIGTIFPYIPEENSTDNNENDRDGDGDAFDQDGGLPQQGFPLFIRLFPAAHPAVASVSPACKSAPLYLLNRVFRI